MSTANAKNGSAIKHRATHKTTSQAPAHRLAPGSYQDPGDILAQIPDLDEASTPKRHEKKADGRIISQALSIKLVFGVGLALLIVAVLPYVFGKASRPGPVVTELPSWSHNGSSTGGDGNTAQTVAPTWSPSPTAPAMAATPPQIASAPAPAILAPQPPQVGDTRPMALTEPSWSQPRPPAAPPSAAAPAPTRNYDNLPPLGATNRPDNRADYRGFDRDPQADLRPANGYPAPDPRNAQADKRADYRGFDRDPQADPRPANGYPGYPAPDPRSVQADNRSDPAAPYRNNVPRYDYRGNTTDTAPGRRDTPADGYRNDTRYDNGSGVYPPAAAPGSPLMPSGAPATTSAYPNPQNSEPGVARFEGTIATPPVRTSYDRAGSSTN